MVSVFVPILYLAVLIGGLSTFSYFYRRKAKPVSQLEEWFPANTARDVYFSLQATEAPDGMLKAALLVRAVEDIRRLQQLQVKKQALNNLIQRGGAGDDLWRRFLQLEEEMKEEVMDVAQEAQALQEGWNQVIFQTANEMYLNDMARQKLSKILPTAKSIVVKPKSDRIEANRRQRIANEVQARKLEKEKAEQQAELNRQTALAELLAMEERDAANQTTTNTKNGSRRR